MVNSYIKEISGDNFSAKDFRTWAGTVHALEAFRELGPAETQTRVQKNIVAALDSVAEQLGNTRTVCKKYYVHPLVIEHYTNGTLAKYFEKMQETGGTLSADEEILMIILEKNTPTVIAA